MGRRGLHPGVPMGDQHVDFGCPENPGDNCLYLECHTYKRVTEVYISFKSQSHLFSQAQRQQWGISETLAGTPFSRPR